MMEILCFIILQLLHDLLATREERKNMQNYKKDLQVRAGANVPREAGAGARVEKDLEGKASRLPFLVEHGSQDAEGQARRSCARGSMAIPGALTHPGQRRPAGHGGQASSSRVRDVQSRTPTDQLLR